VPVIGLPDYYSIRARLFPAILAAVPLLALIAVCVSLDGLNLSQLLVTLAIVVVLYAFSDFARRRGKSIEPALIQKQGGLPSTMMLRHRDETFSAREKARYLGFIAKQLKEKVPSAADEAADPAAADAFYARAASWLRANTRDNKRFNILFDENITYGFHRNLFGLKWLALAANVLVVFITIFLLVWAFPLEWTHPMVQRLVAVLAIAAVHAIYIIAAVTERGTLVAGRQYGRQLILSTEDLMVSSPPAKKKVPAKTKPA
jgi:hypothetical protein